MLSDDEWSALINKLRQLTESEKVKWEVGFIENELYLEVGDVTYWIESKDGDGVPPFDLTIRRKVDGSKAQEVDRLTSRGGPEVDRVPGTKVIPLWDIAKRMSEGGPQLAKSLLDQLSEIDPEPPHSYGAPF